MTTAMESLREMVDVNTVIGDAVTAADGSTIIPVSKVCFGFVSGGGEYTLKRPPEQPTPFAGGAGAGVSVQPMGFLVIRGHEVRMAPAQYCSPLDHAMELAPQLLCELKKLFPSEEKKSSF